MPDLIELIKQQGQLEKDSFGHESGDRNKGIVHSKVYVQLPENDKQLIDQVCEGQRNLILLPFKGNFLLFEYKEGGVARANGKKAGYQVYHCPQNQISSEDTLQSSLSQPQFFNNLQSSLSLLLMVIILIGGVFLVYKINSIGSQLNNEVIANQVANKVPDALKDKGVTTKIIEQLNLNKVEIDEKRLSGLIATKLSSPESNFIAQLATQTADKMPAIEGEKVTNAIAANWVNTHSKVVEQVTKDELATAFASELYEKNKETLIDQLNALKVSEIPKLVAAKVKLKEENQTISIKYIENELVKKFSSMLDTKQFRIALKLAGKFEEIGDDGTWKLKLQNDNDYSNRFLSCPDQASWKELKLWSKLTTLGNEYQDQYDRPLKYCTGDGRKKKFVFGVITYESLKQFGITIDEKGNLYYSPK